jgi:hypothetical protein
MRRILGTLEYMNYIMTRSKYAASYETKRYKFAFCIWIENYYNETLHHITTLFCGPNVWRISIYLSDRIIYLHIIATARLSNI